MTGWKLTPREPTDEMVAQGYALAPMVQPHRIANIIRGAIQSSPLPPEDVVKRAASAFLDEYSATGNEIEAMRAALSAAEERGEQASTSPPSEDRR